MSTRLRNRLYLIGLLPALLMLVVSGRLTVLLVQQSAGSEAYGSERYDEARDAFRSNRTMAPFERWVAPFNEAVAAHRAGEWRPAIESYRAALPHLPPEWTCAVRGNLALAHESVGGAALRSSGRTDAEIAWALGREVLVPCLERSTSPEDGAGRDAREQEQDRAEAVRIDRRLARKLDEDVDRASGPAKPEKRAKAQAKRERELARRNRQAQAERLRAAQRREDARDRRSREEQAADLGQPPPPTEW